MLLDKKIWYCELLAWILRRWYMSTLLEKPISVNRILVTSIDHAKAISEIEWVNPKRPTKKEIYEYLIDQYGQWITYDPEFNQKTLILWTLPILLFIIGGAIIFRKLIVLK